MRFLIVEDDFTSRRVMSLMLSNYATCDVATNGKEALELYRLSIEDGNKYSLITLDIMMPEMTGQEVLKEIREFEMENDIIGDESVKIVMTTALSDKENVKEAFTEQCDAYLVKPVGKDQIEEVLKKLNVIKNV